MEPGTAPEYTNGRARYLKFLDMLIASFTLANARMYGAMCIWTLVLAIFYGMVQDILAESKRDHEFFREEVRRMHEREEANWKEMREFQRQKIMEFKQERP